MADRGTDLEIDETAFMKLDTAQSRLSAILGFEECFALLVDNYSEFEQELVSLALRHILRRNPLDPATGYAAMHALNRRLLNLLTGYKFYCEYAPDQHASFGCPERNEVWAEFRKEFGSNSQLALALELRNYAQHHGVLISGISYPSGWEDRNGQEGQVMRCGIVPVFDRKDMENYTSLDLGSLGDPAYSVRRIIEGVGAIHERLRLRHFEPLATSRMTFHNALQ